MYLTQQTDYAMRVLIYAAVNDGVLVNIGTIAEAYKISKSHLMKVVTALVKGGFLISVRGKGGGLRLAKSAEEIRVGDVVRLIEPMPNASAATTNASSPRTAAWPTCCTAACGFSCNTWTALRWPI